jgi:hypothetical protein
MGKISCREPEEGDAAESVQEEEDESDKEDVDADLDVVGTWLEALNEMGADLIWTRTISTTTTSGTSSRWAETTDRLTIMLMMTMLIQKSRNQ